MVRFSVHTEDASYHLVKTKIYDDHGNIYSGEGELEGHLAKFTFNTRKEGFLHVCITNTGPKFMKIYLDLSTGIEAGDISNVASDKDLKPIERQLSRIERLMNSVKKTTGFIIQKEDAKIQESDSVSGKLYFFSLLTVAILALVSVAQVKYLQRFFKSKKLI